MSRNIARWWILILWVPTIWGGESPEDAFEYAKHLLLEREEIESSISRFEAFASQYPQHRLAPYALAYAAYGCAKIQQHARAVQWYERLLDAYPQAEESLRSDAMTYGGDAAFKNGDFAKAIALYTQLLETFPRSSQVESALFFRGEARYRLGLRTAAEGKAEDAAKLFEEAISDFETFIKTHPESKLLPAVLLSAGFTCLERKDYPRAITFLSQRLQAFPDDPREEECRYSLAEAYYGMGKLAEARREAQVILRRTPESSFAGDAEELLAWCDYAEKKREAAAEGFLRAAERYSRASQADSHRANALRPRIIQAQMNAGLAWQEAGRLSEARRLLESVAAIEGHPAQAKARFRLGQVFLEEARKLAEPERASLLSEAVSEVERAISLGTLDLDTPAAFALLGEIHLDRRDYPAAAQAFSSLVAKWPEHEYAPFALYHWAVAEGENRHYGEAVAAIRQLLVRFPNHPLRIQAAYAMGGYQMAVGKKEKGRLAYTEVAENAKAWAEAHRAPDGAPDPALLGRAEELAADSLFRLGESYYPDEDPHRAATYYRTLLERYPQQAIAHMARLRLAELAESQGRYSEAANYCREILALSSKESEAVGYAQYRIGILALRESQKLPDEEQRRQCLETARRELTSYLERFGSRSGGEAMARKAAYYRAEALYGLGKKEEALRDYRRGYEGDPKGELADRALFGEGWCLYELERHKEALACFAQLLKDYPTSAVRPDALFLSAVLKRRAEDLEGALHDLEQLLQEDPDGVFVGRAEVERARILDAMGKSEEAAKGLEAFLSAHPRDPEVASARYTLSWIEWGKVEPIWRRAKEIQERIEHLQKGRRLGELDEVTQKEIEALQKEWEKESALARAGEDRVQRILETLIQEHPQFPLLDSVFLRLGEIAYEREDYRRAIQRYEEALQAMKNNPESRLGDTLLYRLAWSHLRQAYVKGLSVNEIRKEKEAALAQFESLLHQYPTSEVRAPSAFYAAELRRELGDPEPALRHYDMALAQGLKDPLVRTAMYGRGMALLDLGRPVEALQVFQTFLQTYREGEGIRDAMWGAGEACLRLGRENEAEAWFEKAKVDEEGEEACAKARYGLGMIRLRRQEWEKAREEFRKIDAFYSHYPEWAARALLQAAEASRRLGDRGGARKDLERIVSRYRETTSAREAQAQLQQGGAP